MITPVDEMIAGGVKTCQERCVEIAPHANESRRVLNAFAQHPFRTMNRVAWLAAELFLAALGYGISVTLSRREDLFLTARALWFQRTCRRLSRVFNIEVLTHGTIPTRGLLVSNHLGYIDILVLGSLVPVVFVSKNEVKSWPVFGWFARVAGTIFVHREKRNDVHRSGDEIKQALDRGALVVLFPEGTSSGGSNVLPFKSALLSPATQKEIPLSASLIEYSLDDGSVSEEVCYWGEMTLVPHLLNLLGKRSIHANVSFTQVENVCADRKELARRLHSELLRMKKAFKQ